MDDFRYVFAVLIVTFLSPGLAWWFIIHPFVGFWRRVGVRLTMTIMTVVMIAGVAGLIAVRDRLILTDLGTHTPLLMLAAGLFTVSAWIAIQRKKLLTMRILAGVPELEEGGQGGSLLTEGIYGVVRNPRYLEVAIGTLAYGVFSNYVGAYCMAIVTVPLIHLIVLLEEKELAARFGEEYEAYRMRVPRYIPRRGLYASTT